MPEGHVIHRLARELNEAFAGKEVVVSSPQGRFATSAALLDGRHLSLVQAWGKHLFVSFGEAQGDPVIHIHLGLIGRLRLAPEASGLSPETLRLQITDGRHWAELRGPQTCALLQAGEVAEVVSRLGPDPLREDADPSVAWQRIQRSARPIGALLMDQRVTAGVGNIFRCETLFRQRINPYLPGRELPRRRWSRLWLDLVTVMPAAVESGRIDTVRSEHLPEAMGRPARVDRHGGEVYVYRRAGQECLVCGREVRTADLESRHLYWCQRCQPRR